MGKWIIDATAVPAMAAEDGLTVGPNVEDAGLEGDADADAGDDQGGGVGQGLRDGCQRSRPAVTRADGVEQQGGIDDRSGDHGAIRRGDSCRKSIFRVLPMDPTW